MSNPMIEEQDKITCRTQGTLYEYIVEHGYDLTDFSNKYLASDFCNREMDSIYSVFQREDPVQILDFVIPQIGKLKETKTYAFCAYPFDVGYIYRYLHFLTKLSSKDLVKQIDTKTMIHEMDQRMDWNIEDIAEILAETKLGYTPPHPYEY